MIRCIDALLEGIDANTLVGVDEALVFGTFFNIDVDQLFNHIRHVVLGERGAEDFPQAGITAGTAAQRDLIELGAFFIYAQDADMPLVSHDGRAAYVQ